MDNQRSRHQPSGNNSVRVDFLFIICNAINNSMRLMRSSGLCIVYTLTTGRASFQLSLLAAVGGVITAAGPLKIDYSIITTIVIDMILIFLCSCPNAFDCGRCVLVCLSLIVLSSVLYSYSYTIPTL